MDRAVAAGLPGGHRLGQVGDEEAAAAGSAEGPHHGAKPETVAVGLGDGGAFGAPGARLQQPPIRDERAEVDRENAAGFRVRRACFNDMVRLWREVVQWFLATYPCSGQGNSRIMTSSSEYGHSAGKAPSPSPVCPPASICARR